MQIKGWAGLLTVLVAILAVLQDEVVKAAIPDKYTHYILLATTVIAAVTRAVQLITRGEKLEETPSPGVQE
jgi:hypothetical protein